jgi:hypothetical protein
VADERELLELWWREAARTDPAVHGPGAHTKLSTPSVVQRALNALSQSRFFAGLAERALIFDLEQVRRYLNEPEIRHVARASVEQAVGSDTTVIIAHSLGPIVVYETLCAHPEWPVRTFVTIGSPLGIANLTFDKLQPSPKQGVGVFGRRELSTGSTSQTKVMSSLWSSSSPTALVRASETT